MSCVVCYCENRMNSYLIIFFKAFYRTSSLDRLKGQEKVTNIFIFVKYVEPMLKQL